MPLLIRLNPPKGYRPYGANVNYAPSGEVVDGLPVHYLAQCGWGPGGFGDYVFRQVGNRQAEYIFYKGANISDPMDGRGDLVVGDDGKLYITGQESDDDKLPAVYEVPGYVPVSKGTLNLTLVGDASVQALLTELNALKERVASLESRPAAVTDLSPVTKRLDAIEPVANKANERALNALTQLSKLPAPGISRDEAWQIAADRAYVEVTTEGSGVRNAIKALVQPAQPADLTALTARVTEVEAGLKLRPTGGEVVGIAQQVINGWLEASRKYADKVLLNLMWDRTVKLLRYKERTGKTAEQLPVNDQTNLEV